MRSIKCIFFWQGGVITPALSDVTINTLAQASTSMIDDRAREKIGSLVQDVQLGLIDGETLCNEVVNEFELALKPAQFKARLISNVSCSAELIESIQELSDQYHVWLISDFPSEFHKQITHRHNLTATFKENQIILLPECRLHRIIPDLFFYLAHRAGHPMGECLLIDAETRRAVESVRVGLSATIFVDVSRMKKEFALRSMRRKDDRSTCQDI